MNRKERRSREAQARVTPPGSTDPELREMMRRATGFHREGRIEQAVAVSTILEDTARLLHAASVLGTPEPMPLEEVESGMALKIDRPSLSSNPWTYWSERV